MAWRSEPEPRRTDRMRTRTLLFLGAFVAVVAAAGMWGRAHFYDAVSAEAAPSARQQNPASSNAKPGVPVRVAEVKTATLPITRRTIGWVEPIATVEVKSRIASVIMEQRATE